MIFFLYHVHSNKIYTLRYFCHFFIHFVKMNKEWRMMMTCSKLNYPEIWLSQHWKCHSFQSPKETAFWRRGLRGVKRSFCKINGGEWVSVILDWRCTSKFIDSLRSIVGQTLQRIASFHFFYTLKFSVYCQNLTKIEREVFGYDLLNNILLDMGIS